MKPGRMIPGGMNMQAMMKQAQKLQADMLKKQEELEKMEFTASAGGGVVTATSASWGAGIGAARNSMNGSVTISGGKVVKNTTYWVSVTGGKLPTGTYRFDAEGKMILQNGPVGDYFYIDGVRQNAYSLYEFEGNYYYTYNYHKLSKDVKRYLYASDFANVGLDMKSGYYFFDAEGKLILE